jgi:hypothetical protein
VERIGFRLADALSSRWYRGQPLHRRDELIPPAGDRNDVPFAERAAQLGHGLVEVVLGDDDVRPDRLHQAVLVQQCAGVFEKV